MQKKFKIKGGTQLNGIIKVSGSKNAALPIISAAIMIKGETVLENVPKIADILNLITILNDLNIKTNFKNGTLKIDTTDFKINKISEEIACNMRATILLLGPLLTREQKVKIPFPGGCVIGKRSIFSHMHAFKELAY